MGLSHDISQQMNASSWAWVQCQRSALHIVSTDPQGWFDTIASVSKNGDAITPASGSSLQV